MSPNSASKVALALVLGLTACRAQREILIYSDPPGAEIRLDGTLVPDKTPARIPFKDYGVRRVTLRLDGYLTYSDSFEVKPPWYGYFPVDLLSEIVFPVGWHDRHRLRVTLVKGDTRVEAPDLVEVLGRAEAMRRAPPTGPRAPKEPVRTLPRESSAEIEPAASPPVPAKPPANGGGG
ncbi:MAG TPA: PEGA domain-containing protein [Planctomycetota bacterium]|nr:PEGA domain-containing protein [Planctomycetota bacterium]